MRIQIVNPAGSDVQSGNFVTAARWQELLRELGHEVSIATTWDGTDHDVLIGLHARKSFDSVSRFHAAYPQRPVVVAMTGTDLYYDIHHDRDARQALDLAARLVLLQPLGARELPAEVQPKARTIYQSSRAPEGTIEVVQDGFAVCVMGHLRPVKDPFRAAAAARLLPETSQISIIHLGAAIDDALATRAREEMETNPRYRWLGELPRRTALRILAGAKVLAHTSEAEGGANVVTEAIAASVPVIASRIEGTIGLLGEDHPAYFSVGATEELAALLRRVEEDAAFLDDLRGRTRKLQPLVDPARERASWKELLDEILAPR